MARRFEELVIWQQARKLANRCLDIADRKSLRDLWPVKSQFVSAGLSAMNNIAEGFERGGNREFKNFLIISKASVGEVRSMTYLFADRGWLSQHEQRELLSETNHLAAGIRKLMNHLESSDFEGVNRGDVIRDHEYSNELPSDFFTTMLEGVAETDASELLNSRTPEPLNL